LFIHVFAIVDFDGTDRGLTWQFAKNAAFRDMAIVLYRKGRIGHATEYAVCGRLGRDQRLPGECDYRDIKGNDCLTRF
jgi:hypothetical protein